MTKQEKQIIIDDVYGWSLEDFTDKSYDEIVQEVIEYIELNDVPVDEALEDVSAGYAIY